MWSLVLPSMPEDLLVFSRPESRKWQKKLHLCSCIQTQTSPNWLSVLHSLHALPAAVLTIPSNSTALANHKKSAKHIVVSHVFFQTRPHLH